MLKQSIAPLGDPQSGAAVPLLLTELRLPTIKRLCAELAAQSNRGGWPAERLLHTLLGIVTERDLMTRVLAKAVSPQTTPLSEVMTRGPYCVGPELLVADAVLIMIERGFRHLPIVGKDQKIMGVFSVRDALPREISAAVSLAEFHEQVNDALG